MPEVTITPKHARLIAFLAGKGVRTSDKPVTVDLSDNELGPLLRKAKEFDFEDQIVVKGKSKAEKAAAKAEKAAAKGEPVVEEVAEEVEETTEDADAPATPRRRRL